MSLFNWTPHLDIACPSRENNPFNFLPWNMQELCQGSYRWCWLFGNAEMARDISQLHGTFRSNSEVVTMSLSTSCHLPQGFGLCRDTSPYLLSMISREGFLGTRMEIKEGSIGGLMYRNDSGSETSLLSTILILSRGNTWWETCLAPRDGCREVWSIWLS